MKNKIYDAAAALKHVGYQQELADEMLQMLRADLKSYRIDLEKALEHEDIGAVEHIAHRLSGAARWCGAEQLLDVSEDVLASVRRREACPVERLAERLQGAMDAFLDHSARFAP